MLLNFLAAAFPDPDSLVRFSDLRFESGFEKTTLSAFNETDRTRYTNLFLTTYTNTSRANAATAQQQIKECVAYLEKKTAKFSQPKRVKFIYKYVHERFFKVYKYNNSFSDIFTKGEYNCVSGSALYAIVFGEMGIPYQIMEAPQHVFLFAYPESHKIMIETTNARNGYIAFTDDYISRYVKYMAEAKLIGEDDMKGLSQAELFNKYYFAQQGISIRELAGIQYGNFAVYCSEAHEQKKALDNARKFYFLSPSPRARYMLRNALYEVIASCDYQQQEDVENLLLLCRFNNADKKETSSEAVRQEFLRLTEQQFIRNSDYNLYRKSYEAVSAAVTDSLLKNELAFIYHYEMARVGSQDSRPEEVIFAHLEAAYRVNPRHAELRSMIRNVLFLHLANSNTSALIREIDGFSGTFDFINADEKFNTIRANVLLEMAYQAYSLNKIETGDTELGRFERLCEEHTGLRATEMYVEKAYSVAASAYFKRGNKSRTRELLNTGIKYAPNSFGLHNRLRQLR